jgi:hypothetical protein
MGTWLKANGGPVAVVLAGFAVGGITSRPIGVVLVALGAIGFIVQSTPWWRRRTNGPPERARQQEILQTLHREYLLTHDGITPSVYAGTAPLPKDWVELRLGQLGETWRRDHYIPYGPAAANARGESGVVVERVLRPGGDRLEVFGTVDGVAVVGHGWESALTNYLPPDQDVRDENGNHLPGYGNTRQATPEEQQLYYEQLLRATAGQPEG